MKPWERDIIEYRPKLGFTPQILSVVYPDPEEVYKPTAIVKRATNILGSNIIENTMASLSRANQMINNIKKCIANEPNYMQYNEALDDEDFVEAKNIYETNLTSIDGVPQLDVLPMLTALKSEMESYLDYLNTQLFEGEVDYNDIESTRKKEEDNIEYILKLEADGHYNGYNTLRSRIQMLATANARSDFYKNSIDYTEHYLTRKDKDYVNEDVNGMLEYITKIPNTLYNQVRNSIKVEFNRNAHQSLLAINNMQRVGGQDVRNVLDQELAAVKDKMHTTCDPLQSYYMDDNLLSDGAESVKAIISFGIEAIMDGFEEMVVEHLSNTELNNQQLETTFGYLNDKKQVQLMNQLINKVEDEIDPDNLEKDIPRFIKNNDLLSGGTICG